MGKHTKIFAGAAIVIQVTLIIGIICLMVQNAKLADMMKEYVSYTGEIHEIYDDTAVVEAYKTGNSDGLGEQDKYVLEQATKVIEENITDDMTDYEKEKAIYDWQVAYVSYSNQNLSAISSGDEYSHLPYGVFKYHQAICVGDATTFKLFMDMLGIECQIIHSTEEGEHAWDLVKLDDEWYHVDIFFDGGTGDHPAYSYFNVPDSVKDNGSYPWDHDTIPAAEGTKYCYIANNAGDLKDIYELPAYIQEQIEAGSQMIYFKLEDPTGYTQTVADYLNLQMCPEGGEMYTSSTMVIGDDTIYSIMVDTGYDENYENGEDEASMEVISKLEEIIYDLR